MACILMLQCNFTHEYFRYILLEETIGIEIRAHNNEGYPYV